MPSLRHLLLTATLGGCLISAAPAFAQSYPDRPTRPYGDELFPNALYISSSYQGDYTGYPAAEVRAVPAAAAMATGTRWEHRNAIRNLDRAVRDTVRNFERSQDYRQAMAEEQRAFEEYEAARERALAPLADDPDYQAHMELQDRLREIIVNHHEQPEPAVEAIRANAMLRLNQLKAASAKENALIDESQEVKDALLRLREAHNRVLAMREEFDSQVRADAALEERRLAVQQTRVAKLVAITYLDRVIEAREIALDYAYYLHKPRSKVSHTYYGSPYLPYFYGY